MSKEKNNSTIKTENTWDFHDEIKYSKIAKA